MSDPLVDNIERNLNILASLRKSNPSMTHIYMRRTDKDGLVIDIPVEHAEATIRLRKHWEVVASNKQMDDAVEQLFKEPEAPVELEVPPRPSEILPPAESLPPLDPPQAESNLTEAPVGLETPPVTPKAKIPNKPIAKRGRPKGKKK